MYQKSKYYYYCRTDISLTNFEKTFTSSLIFFDISHFSLTTINSANNVIMQPWPASPNMTANKNGNVITVYGAAKD